MKASDMDYEEYNALTSQSQRDEASDDMQHLAWLADINALASVAGDPKVPPPVKDSVEWWSFEAAVAWEAVW